jgi:dihydrofolate reductase
VAGARGPSVGKLIYAGITSLDGYTEDTDGDFQWSAPDEEVHRFVNDLTRSAGTHLLGRRMYETMAYWDGDDSSRSNVEDDFAAIWQAADKTVYSRTIEEPLGPGIRVERDFQPDAVRALKEASDRELTIGGPELAAHAVAAGLVDEYQQFVNPVIVGGGKPFLPGGVRIELDLVEERRFVNGVVYLRYAAGAG